MSLPKTGFIRSTGHYLFFGNAFIALCALCQFWSTCLLLQLPLPVHLSALVFTATFLLYNFDSVLPYKMQQHVTFSRRRAWVQTHRTQIIILMILASVLALYLFFRTYYHFNILLFGHLVVLSLLYSLPVVPLRGRFVPLRDIPLLKIFLIAYVWTSVTVWLPLAIVNQNIAATTIWLLFSQRFTFVLTITIIFDIRDVERDKVTRTVTLPGTIGVKRAKYIAWLSLGLFCMLVALSPQESSRIALWFSALAAVWVVWRTHPAKSEYFFVVVADGLMFLQFLLLWLFI